MKLTFTHRGASLEAESAGIGSGSAKLYRVPREYSEDGYYIAVRQDTEIEPVPACAVSDAAMLCHARIENNADNGLVVKVVESHEEAGCHA